MQGEGEGRLVVWSKHHHDQAVSPCLRGPLSAPHTLGATPRLGMGMEAVLEAGGAGDREQLGGHPAAEQGQGKAE